jgi:hypothetical protein
MPQVKKVKPLFELCLQFITFNMKYWCNQLEKKITWYIIVLALLMGPLNGKKE